MVPMKIYNRGMTSLYYTWKDSYCHEILDLSDNVKKTLNAFFLAKTNTFVTSESTLKTEANWAYIKDLKKMAQEDK